MAKGPNVFQRLKANWGFLKKGKPGSRFLDCYHYKQELRHKYGPIYRRVDIGVGLATTTFGLIMVPAPGPGWIIVFCGFALLAGESKGVAKAMDRGEVKLRGFRARVIRSWRKASLVLKSTIALSAGAILSAIAYGAYAFFFAG